MAISPPDEKTTISGRFCQNDAEVTFLSADNVAFKIHLTNLETSTGGFPPSDFKPIPGEVTQLPERSETLELLFAFIYPSRHPTLDPVTTDLLLNIADAAEKYEVFAAINICNIRIKAIVKQEPLRILIHAFKYDYPSIINEAAPFLHDFAMTDLVKQLPLALVVPLITYLESRRSALINTFQNITFQHHGAVERCRCGLCEQDLAYIMYKLFEGDHPKLCKASVESSIAASFSQARHLTYVPEYEELITAIPEPPEFTTFL